MVVGSPQVERMIIGCQRLHTRENKNAFASLIQWPCHRGQELRPFLISMIRSFGNLGHVVEASLPVPASALPPNRSAQRLGRDHLLTLLLPGGDAVSDTGAHHVNLDELWVFLHLVGGPGLVVVKVVLERGLAGVGVDLVVRLSHDTVVGNVFADGLGLVTKSAPEKGLGLNGVFLVAGHDGPGMRFGRHDEGGCVSVGLN